MNRSAAFLLALLPSTILFAPAAIGADAPETGIVQSSGSYLSQGKMIRVERFEPRAEGKYPAVMLLHGSAGMAIGGKELREAGRKLAAEGFVAHLVHYFDATGTRRADKQTMINKFPNWIQTLADGLTYLARQPNVDSKHLGLVGFSLGGYLSVSLAMYDPRVSAVVEYFGGLPSPLAKDLRELPPTLILHGEDDKVVPVAEARTLASRFRAKQLTHELKIYQGQGHGLIGRDADDAAERTLRFLDRHVRKAPEGVRHEVARPRFDRIDALKSGAANIP